MVTKIVQLSSVHPAQDTRILHKECRTLALAGFEVTLIANDESDYEQYNVKIRALPKHTGSRMSRMIKQSFNIYRMAREERGDLYHFHDPELMFVGLALRLTGKPVVFDVHESVSRQILTKGWIPRPFRRIVSRAYRLLEQTLSRAFSAIVIAEPSIQQFFPESKTTVIHNYPRLEEIAVEGGPPIAEREDIVFYVGGVTTTRGAVDMVNAIELVSKHREVKFILGGPTSSESLTQKLLSMPGAAHTELPGRLSRDEVVRGLQQAKVGLVVLHPIPNYVEAFPVKIFEYMAAGLPVIASNFPYWRQFVTDIGSGLMVEPGNAEEIAQAIETILNDPEMAQRMGDIGAAAVRERWNWDTEAEKLVHLVRRLTRTGER